MQAFTPDAERMGQVLAGTGPEAVERDGEAMNP
jgi:hypothetical protein